jgi:cob(I)alamin adenosyltransferase
LAHHRAALGQQRHRHQLERGVLRAADLTSPVSRAPPWTRITSTRAMVWLPSAGSVGWTHGRSSHRIYTRPATAGGPRLGNNEVAAKTDPRIVAYADPTSATPRSVWPLALGDLRDDVRAVVTRSRTTCSTWARTCAIRSPPTRPIRRLRISRGVRDAARGLVRRVQTPSCRRWTSFVLPGGTAGCRAAARRPYGRAPRGTVGVGADGRRSVPHVDLPAKYLNRLSDLLFILARTANPQGEREVGSPAAPRRANPLRRSWSCGCPFVRSNSFAPTTTPRSRRWWPSVRTARRSGAVWVTGRVRPPGWPGGPASKPRQEAGDVDSAMAISTAAGPVQQRSTISCRAC